MFFWDTLIFILCVDIGSSLQGSFHPFQVTILPQFNQRHGGVTCWWPSNAVLILKIHLDTRFQITNNTCSSDSLGFSPKETPLHQEFCNRTPGVIELDTQMPHCTTPKLQWEVGNRNFSFLIENYIWNIWTRIKWEAKLTNLSEIFGCC